MCEVYAAVRTIWHQFAQYGKSSRRTGQLYPRFGVARPNLTFPLTLPEDLSLFRHKTASVP